MSITEFLEARIAEDEDEANACLEEYRQGSDVSKLRWLKVLAECKAKRAILSFDQDLQIWEPRGFSSDTDAGAFMPGAPKSPQARYVTRILAAVYADHPDYQQEWAL